MSLRHHDLAEDSDEELLQAALRQEEEKQEKQEPIAAALDAAERVSRVAGYQGTPIAGGKYLKARSLRDTLYGQICIGVHLESGHRVVIKEYNKQQVLLRKDRFGQALAENPQQELPLHAFLSKYRHPFILELMDVCEDEHRLYAIQEWCSGGDLFSYAQSGKFFPEVARHYFVQLAQGVDFLHRMNVAHSDLSLENLLLNGDRVLKICDFGAAIRLPAGEDKRIKHASLADVGGRLQYLAPEVLSGQPYDPRARDVWALGIILFALLLGRFPFQQPAPADPGFRNLTSNPHQFIRHVFAVTGPPPPPPQQQQQQQQQQERTQIRAQAVDLLSHILVAPVARWTLEQVLKHPFCAGLLQPPSPRRAVE